MNELRQTVIHHIEQAAIAAGVRFDFDCRRELEADFDAAEQRVAILESRLQNYEVLVSALQSGVSTLESRLEQLQEQVDQPNWRERP